MSGLRLPPLGYVFASDSYADKDDPLNAEYAADGEQIKSAYPELIEWPNWACCVAYMDFGETTKYCGNPYNGEKRKEEFLAFLYSEQELGENGFFLREDGTQFTHYDLEHLDASWAMYDEAKSNRK
jgi:hypothetical protein